MHIIRPHTNTAHVPVDAAYWYRLSSVVCQSVTVVSPAKMAESIEMPYGLRTWVGPRKHVFGETDRAQLLVSVNLGQLTRHSVRPAAGLVLSAALSRTCRQGRDLACPWVVVTACENRSHCPPLNDGPAAAVTACRSCQCQAECWLNHGLLAATSRSKDFLERKIKSLLSHLNAFAPTTWLLVWAAILKYEYQLILVVVQYTHSAPHKHELFEDCLVTVHDMEWNGKTFVPGYD